MKQVAEFTVLVITAILATAYVRDVRRLSLDLKPQYAPRVSCWYSVGDSTKTCNVFGYPYTDTDGNSWELEQIFAESKFDRPITQDRNQK